MPQPGVEKKSPMREPERIVFTYNPDLRGATKPAKRICWHCGDELPLSNHGHAHDHDCMNDDGMMSSSALSYNWED